MIQMQIRLLFMVVLLDNTFGSGGYFNGNQHLIFDSYKDCNIKSVVYVDA